MVAQFRVRGSAGLGGVVMSINLSKHWLIWLGAAKGFIERIPKCLSQTAEWYRDRFGVPFEMDQTVLPNGHGAKL